MKITIYVCIIKCFEKSFLKIIFEKRVCRLNYTINSLVLKYIKYTVITSVSKYFSEVDLPIVNTLNKHEPTHLNECRTKI